MTRISKYRSIRNTVAFHGESLLNHLHERKLGLDHAAKLHTSQRDPWSTAHSSFKALMYVNIRDLKISKNLRSLANKWTPMECIYEYAAYKLPLAISCNISHELKGVFGSPVKQSKATSPAHFVPSNLVNLLHHSLVPARQRHSLGEGCLKSASFTISWYIGRSLQLRFEGMPLEFHLILRILVINSAWQLELQLGRRKIERASRLDSTTKLLYVTCPESFREHSLKFKSARWAWPA